MAGVGISVAMHLLFLLALVKEINAATTSFYNTDKCGKSAGCWYFPNGCSPELCQAIIRWKVHKNLIRVELQAKDLEAAGPDSGRYMALGFSVDKFMDNDTVIECVFDAKGKAKAFVSYNDHSSNIRLEDASSKMIKLRTSTMSDGRLLCKMDVNFGKHKKLQKDEQNKIINTVKGNKWTLLFAQGLADPQTWEKFIHAFPSVTTNETVDMDDDKYQVVKDTSPHNVARRLRRSV